MNAWSDPRRRLGCALAVACTALALLAVLLAARPATAAPQAVEAFERQSWPRLQAELAQRRQPAVVVFTTTDCTHCPAALKRVAQVVRAQRLPALQMAVVMDVAPGEDDAALLHHAPYGSTDRLWAFAGPSGALQYAVDPGWRGVSPYVALLLPGQPPRFVLGIPSPEDLAPWAREAARLAPAR